MSPMTLPKLGRNDPCPCGSNKKFKHCCPRPGTAYSYAYAKAGRWPEVWDAMRWGSLLEIPELPRWDGACVNELLILHDPMGAGDAMWLARFLPIVAQRVKRLVVLVKPELVSLLRTVPGVADVQPLPELTPAFVGGVGGSVTSMTVTADAYLPLGGLPRALKATPMTAPTNGYFDIHPRTPRRPPRRIAFAWRGTSDKADQWRRTTLADWRPLFAAMPDTTWLACARDHREELRNVEAPNIEDAADGLTDWLATARLLATCDLVVTVDTGLAHLAAALGVPTWVLVGTHNQIYWLGDRSPWYPSARLFHCATPGDWTPVLAAVRAALLNLNGVGQ